MSPDRPRGLVVDDLDPIWKAGCAHVERLKVTGKAWAQRVDPAHVFRRITSGEVQSFVVGDYLVVFDISDSWHSPGAKLFEELLTLRLHPENGAGNFRSVIRAIEGVASANGCVGVLLGTAGSYDARLGRVIRRLGYSGTAESLYKEL